MDMALVEFCGFSGVELLLLFVALLFVLGVVAWLDSPDRLGDLDFDGVEELHDLQVFEGLKDEAEYFAQSIPQGKWA